MKKAGIIQHAMINALGTAFYVAIVASFMYFFSQGNPDGNPTILIPITMLMIFVFSAAFTGFLILGKPIMWYIDGKKKEALSLLLYTLGMFFIITIIVLSFLVLLIK